MITDRMEGEREGERMRTTAKIIVVLKGKMSKKRDAEGEAGLNANGK